jgi:hypothetical protein
MICKKTCGKGGRSLAEYLLRDGRGQIVAGTMAGSTPRELAAELGQLRRLNPKLGKAIAHFSLNPSPDDPPMSEEQFDAIAARFMNEMGFDDSPWVGVIHRDAYFDGQPRPHLHILALRLDSSGRTVSDANDFRKAEASMRGIERDFGLISVPDPPRRKSKPTPTTKTTTQGEDAMNDTQPTPPTPFKPGDSQYETWPDAFEPGRDLAVSAFVEAAPEAVVPSASVADKLTDRKHRDIRRIVMEKGYEQHVRAILGSDLTRVYIRKGVGAVLCFREGRITDSGDKLSCLGGGVMPEELAAQRIVALACSRNWRSITFTGSPRFIELSMRLAMSNGLRIDARGLQQEAILAKLEAEKRGGMGAMSGMAGPAINTDPILAPLAELDDIEAQTLPRTAPTPAPVAPPPASHEPQQPRPPVVGVVPAFPNLRERLKERRDRLASNQPSPSQQVPPKRPGPRFS